MYLIEASNLTAIDILIIIVMAVGVIMGFWKGVIRQAFSLGGLIVGLIMGRLFSGKVSLLFLDSFNMSEKSASILAFILILVVVPIAFMLLGGFLSKVVKIVKLGLMDRLLGALFGLLKYTVFLGLAMQLLDYSGLSDNFVKEDAERRSALYEPVRKVTDFSLRWTWNHIMEHTDIELPELKNGADE